MGSADQYRTGLSSVLPTTAKLDTRGLEERIPALRTYTAFFTSLKANLALPEASAPPSPALPLATPPPAIHHDTPLSPFEGRHRRSSSLKLLNVRYAEPIVSCYSTLDDADRAQALELISLGVLEQQTEAFIALMRHPINLCAMALFLLLFQRTMLRSVSDLLIGGFAWASVISAALITAAWASWPYRGLAKQVTREWLGEDELLVASVEQHGIIGAVVMNWRWTCGGDGKGRRKRVGRAYIRAWMVATKDRGKGVGRFLLQEAAQLVARRGAEHLNFADKHANSSRVLPKIYNGGFDKREHRAQAALNAVMENLGRARKR